MTVTAKWNDGMLCGSRVPMLVVVHDERLYRFNGEHIPGVLAVVGDVFHKNGKWSNTEWTFRLAEGAKTVEVVKDLHGGPWLSKFESWDAVADRFGVSREETERFFRGLDAYGKGCAILDEREAALTSLEV